MAITINDLSPRLIASINNSYLSKAHTSTDPVIHILGGQPAAGKSNLIEYLKQAEQEYLVVINGDELRKFHPDHAAINKEGNRNAADETQAFSNSCVQHLMQICFKEKYSFIVEGTMRNPKVPIETAEAAKSFGFEVNAHILAVPFEVSLLRSYQRYVEGLKNSKTGRFANIEIQKQAFDNLPESADKLMPYLHSLTVYANDPFEVLEEFDMPTSKPSSLIKKYQTITELRRFSELALDWGKVQQDLISLNQKDALPMEQAEKLIQLSHKKKLKLRIR